MHVCTCQHVLGACLDVHSAESTPQSDIGVGWYGMTQGEASGGGGCGHGCTA